MCVVCRSNGVHVSARTIPVLAKLALPLALCCSVSFAAFICRKMTPTHWVLEADDNILCSDPVHQAIRGLSGVVVVVFAFGLPITFGYILLRLARSYDRETRGTNAVLARRVAEDLKVD